MPHNPSAEQNAAKLEASGWSPTIHTFECGPTVPVWLYCHGYRRGPRLTAQMPLQIYNHGLAPETIALLPGLPVDNYLQAVREIDRLPNQDQAQHHIELSARMMHFTRSTKLWGVLPSAASTAGIHIVLTDWKTWAEDHIVVQGAVLAADVLTPDVVEEVARMAMTIHLSKNPEDAPVEI